MAMKSDLKTYALIAAVVINLGLGLYNTVNLENYECPTQDTVDRVLVSIADLEWAALSCEEKVELLKESIQNEHNWMLTYYLDPLVEYTDEHEARIGGLEARIEELENTIATLETLSTPIFDSGWVSIDQDEYKWITVLENPNVFVYMIGRRFNDDGSIQYPAHQVYYGGDSTYEQILDLIPLRQETGAKWYIKADNTLKVHRFDDDEWYPEVRLIVWQLP